MALENCCAFTGNRNVKEDLNVNKLIEIIKGLIQNGVDTFYDGMARGFDLIAARCVINLKKEFPNIKLIACVPCPNQEKYFKEEDKKEYYDVLEKCDEVKILSKHYHNGCMFIRNRYMVDNSKYLIAYNRTTDGGTEYTVNYVGDNEEKEVYMM